jgi:hypothetical protein
LIRPLIAIFLVLTTALVATAQTKERFDPSGSFWIEGQPPAEFKDFGGINLNMRRLRRLPTSGVQLNNGANFRFRTITIKQNNFTFTTAALRGVSYSFAGKFLKGGDFAATWTGEDEPVLEGVLTKFKNGKKIAEAKLKFIYFGGT